MKRFILICLLLCLIPVYAQDEPVYGVIHTSDDVSDGYILFSPMRSNFTYLIDNEGNLIHQWVGEYPMLSVYLLENGHLLASSVKPTGIFPPGRAGRVEEFDWEGNLIWSYELDNDNARQHHDIEVLPNGNILMSVWQRLDPTQFDDYGIRPDTVGEEVTQLFYDYLIEVDPTTNEIVWEWHTLDHTVQNYDDSLSNYGNPVDNPQLIDINFSVREPGVSDRTHFNAIDYNPELDQIMVSAHFQSEIWIIDHATGEIVYRWGNPQAYGRGTAEDRQLYVQHNPTWLDNGNILIFNNGSEVFRRYSTVVEITPPLLEDGSYYIDDAAAYEPTDLVWEYRHDPPEDFYARNTSGAQRLPNGNTFVTHGPDGRLFEIDADGTVVWEYINPIWQTIDPPSVSVIFRATRYPPDYPAFEGRDLTPLMPLPLTIAGD